MKPKNFQASISALLCSLLLAGSVAKAECMGPLCNNMHNMSNSLDCLQKKLPSFLCSTTPQEEITTLKTNAEEARATLLKDTTFADSQRTEINQLFDQLAVAIDQLSQALTQQDPAAQDVAFKAIANVRKLGHLDFKD